MKCNLLVHTTWRNSIITIKTYENWCPHDEHSCSTCVKVAELSEGALENLRTPAKMTEEAVHFFENYYGVRKT